MAVPCSLMAAHNLEMGGGTVGQDVDELICQSERKMQQNATFYLCPLLSLKPDFFLMIVPPIFFGGHFCFFEGVTLAYIVIFG